MGREDSKIKINSVLQNSVTEKLSRTLNPNFPLTLRYNLLSVRKDGKIAALQLVLGNIPRVESPLKFYCVIVIYTKLMRTKIKFT
jgi:hypothetical protein